MARECMNIEPNRTSIASIRSAEEQSNVLIEIPDEKFWTGGVQIGDKLWYWYSYKSNSRSFVGIKEVGYTHWYKGEPNNPLETCLELQIKEYSHTWNDVQCMNKQRAICELRC